MVREDMIVISGRELRRLHVVRKVLEKSMRQVEGAGLLSIGVRQLRRIVKRVREQGDVGVVHRLTGN